MKKTTRRERAARFQAELDAAVVGIHRLYIQEQAHEEREQAVSWRDCKTGGAAIIVLPDGTYRVIRAHNYKPERGPRVMGKDYCAEMKLEEERRKKSARMVYAAVESPPETDDASGYAPPEKVMVFCVYCRSDVCPHLPPEMPITFINGEDRNLRHHNTVAGVIANILAFEKGRA